MHGPYRHPKNQFRVDHLSVEYDPDVKISHDLPHFTKNGQLVTVRWQGVKDPSEQDLIAMYVPANANPWKTAPIQYLNCSAVPGYLNSGAGQAQFVLLNMRGGFRFKLVRGGYFRPRLVSQALPIVNLIPFAPTGGHLALHQDDRSLVVQWMSGQSAPQQVQWGTAQQLQALQAGSTAAGSNQPLFQPAAVPSTVSTYKASDMCGWPANSTGWLDPGFIHTAVIPHTQLQPGARYWYRYGAEGDGWSDTHSFLAPWGPGWQQIAAHQQQQQLHQHQQLQRQQLHSNQHPQPQAEKHATNGGVPAGTSSSSGASGSVSDTAPGMFKFLAFNDVAMTYPLLFRRWDGHGLYFNEVYGQNSSRLAERLGGRLPVTMSGAQPDSSTSSRSNQLAASDSAPEQDASLALLVGDLAYALGYGADWDVFAQQFEHAFTRWPLVVGTGNHERDWPHTDDAFGNSSLDSGGECNVPFMHRYYSPANARGDPRTSYFSFNQGPVHFLVLDSETPSGPDTPQGRFVASDLAAVDRQLTPWVVAAMHRMIVAPASWRHKWTGDVDNMERLQSDYEELFKQYQVDVVIQGHEHAYARTCPLYKMSCTTSTSSSHTANSRSHSSKAATGLSIDGAQMGGALQREMSSSRKLLEDAQQHEQTQGQQQHQRQGGAAVMDVYEAPAGGPVYVLAGHGGAGFTYGFPTPLQDWVRSGVQGVNGYLRFSVTQDTLHMEAVGAQGGSVMDRMQLVRSA